MVGTEHLPTLCGTKIFTKGRVLVCFIFNFNTLLNKMSLHRLSSLFKFGFIKFIVKYEDLKLIQEVCFNNYFNKCLRISDPGFSIKFYPFQLQTQYYF